MPVLLCQVATGFKGKLKYSTCYALVLFKRLLTIKFKNMSILRMDYYTVKCDNCGKLFADEYNGFSAWNDENGAMEYASEANWIREDDKHFCPDCYEYDDDDNLIIKPVKCDADSQHEA